MKKIMLLLILPILTVIKLEAQEIYECPPGATLQSFTAVYYYGQSFNCEINVKYCCWWDNTTKTIHKRIMEFSSKGYVGPRGGNCLATILDWEHFTNWLLDEVSKHADINCVPEYPPCDETNEVNYVQVSIFGCRYIESVLEYIGDDTYSLRFRPCYETVKCIKEYVICYDYNHSPPELVIFFIREYIDGTPNCSPSFPQIPPPGYDWNEPWTTECYMNFRCN